jgi:hypothetical protein
MQLWKLEKHERNNYIRLAYRANPFSAFSLWADNWRACKIPHAPLPLLSDVFTVDWAVYHVKSELLAR